MKRFIGLALSLALAAGTAVGCSGGGKAEEKGLKQDEAAVLKVMYYDERNFFSEYGNLFLSKFPNVDLQVVSTQSLHQENKDYKTALQEFIEEQQPDVLMLDSSQLETYARDGKLLELDPLIKRDGFDTAGLYPGMLDMLRTKGGGKLYAMSPRFYSQALFYNKDLFDQYGVTYPTNQMSWDDFLALVKRFPTDGDEKSRVYGLYQQAFSGGLFQFGMMLGASKGLSYVDPENMKITIHTDAWKSVLQTAMDTMKSGAVNEPKAETMSKPATSFEDYLMQNLFIAGRAAMYLEGPYMLDNLSRAKDALKNAKLPNWDVVTVPVDPSKPDISTGVSFNQLFAIRSDSPNARAAWELIRYINSDECAKIISKSPLYGGLLSRTAYNKDKDGHNLEAFYMLKPAENESFLGFDKLPSSFFMQFMGLADQELRLAYDGKKTLDEALQAIQSQGQDMLLKAKDAEDQAKAAK